MRIQLVVACRHPTKLFEAAEKPFYAVALGVAGHVVGPRGAAFAAGRNHRLRAAGRKVLVEYVDGHGEGPLVVNSQVVPAQVAAEKLAKQKADVAARAASLKADNAVPRTH